MVINTRGTFQHNSVTLRQYKQALYNNINSICIRYIAFFFSLKQNFSIKPFNLMRT